MKFLRLLPVHLFLNNQYSCSFFLLAQSPGISEEQASSLHIGLSFNCFTNYQYDQVEFYCH